MGLGGKLLSGAAVFAVAACASDQGTLTIRPTSTTLATGEKPVRARIGEGHAQLALGNAGLALELFRKALREDPASAEANAGIAVSYDRMNRFDLSRRYFEAALSIAPADLRILGQLAASLDRQGERSEAADVRREIAKRHEQAIVASASKRVPVPMEAAAVAGPMRPAPLPVRVPRLKPEAAKPQLVAQAPAKRVATVVAPPPVAAPAVVVASAPVPAPAPHEAVKRVYSTTPVARSAPVAALTAVSDPTRAGASAGPPVRITQPDIAFLSAPGADSAMPPNPTPVIAPHAPAATVTVTLPPARPTPAPPASVKAQPNAIAPPTPATDEHMAVRAPSKPSPRLERMSPTEVALTTRGVVQWRQQVVAKTARVTTIRFVPLKSRGRAVASVQLLNAARHRGLAARTRAYLAAKGWRRLVIGDAHETRQTSVIYYPQSRRRTAEILAAQFRIRVARRVGEGNAIVMLLGRDAVPAKAAGNRA